MSLLGLFKSAEIPDYFPEKSTQGWTPEFRAKMNGVRHRFGKPIRVNSAYRSPVQNKNAGGTKGSYHTKGRAADIKWYHYSALDRAKLIKIILEMGLYLGVYNRHLHIDDSKSGVYFGGGSK